MTEQIGSSGLSLMHRLRRRRSLKWKKKKEMLYSLLKDYALFAQGLQLALHEKCSVLRQAFLALKKCKKDIKNLVRKKKNKNKKKKVVQIAANVGEKEDDKGYEGSSKQCEGYRGAEDEGKEEAKIEAGVADDNGAFRVCSDRMKKYEGEAKFEYIDDASARHICSLEEVVKGLRSLICVNDTNFIPAGGKSVDYEKWARYYMTIQVCEEFDVDDDVYSGPCASAHIIPATDVEKDSYFIQASITTLQFFNATNVENYEFYKVVRVNYQIVGRYTCYYITFEANNSKASHAVETFQTLLLKFEQSEEPEVKFCRIKEEATIEAGVADDNGALRVCSNWMNKGVGNASVRYLSYIEDKVKNLRSSISENNTHYIPAGGKTVDYDKWARYKLRIQESEKFDVDDDVYPGHCPMACIIPATNVEKDSYFIQASITALQFFNATNVENYQFYKVVRVNYQMLFRYTCYYITFEAKNSKVAHAVETFQALLVKFEQSEEPEVKFCRIKKPFCSLFG